MKECECTCRDISRGFAQDAGGNLGEHLTETAGIAVWRWPKSRKMSAEEWDLCERRDGTTTRDEEHRMAPSACAPRERPAQEAAATGSPVSEGVGRGEGVWVEQRDPCSRRCKKFTLERR